MPFEPIRIYFSDLRSSAEVQQAIAGVFTDCITGVIQAVHRLIRKAYRDDVIARS